MNKNIFFRWVPSKNSVIHPLQAWAGFFFLLFFSIPFLSGICAAQSEKEMKVLQMFFEEKDLFASVTRNPKPVSQIPENVTIVTAKEIEAMNAHSVAEVLNRVTGLFVNFSQGKGTAGSTSLLHVQGSEDRHVLVLVDGIPWNSMAGGPAETNTIPVGIIERIEIIKGPASSSWGSSLGGAVHIITKSPGYTSGPAGSVRTSYGEMKTTDHRAQISGRAGRLGYYLFGGRQDSDGPEDARDYENTALFSRFSYTASNRVEMELSFGYTRPETGLGDYESIDLRSTGDIRSFWANARFDATFTRDLSFKLRLFRFEQETGIANRALGLGITGSAGDLYRADNYEEATTGGRAKLIWEKGIHTVVTGMDFNRGDLDQTINSGQFLQAQGAPAYFHTRPDVRKTGVFVNDTIVLERLSVTPGLRYDHHSESGSFLSPSLGLAYTLGNETILRGSVARGFTAPPLSWTSGGALGLAPNPSLEEETVW
ncbi:MAG: TonB-dependent receptor, partial [Desulfobacteraceae bacterium]|nr:TonB-dependent receptor [Desulfobacteraceae bacterium]